MAVLVVEAGTGRRRLQEATSATLTPGMLFTAMAAAWRALLESLFR